MESEFTWTSLLYHFLFAPWADTSEWFYSMPKDAAASSTDRIIYDSSYIRYPLIGSCNINNNKHTCGKHTISTLDSECDAFEFIEDDMDPWSGPYESGHVSDFMYSRNNEGNIHHNNDCGSESLSVGSGSFNSLQSGVTNSTELGFQRAESKSKAYIYIYIYIYIFQHGETENIYIYTHVCIQRTHYDC